MIDGVNRQLSMVEDEGHDSGSDSYHSTASYVSLTDIEVCTLNVELNGMYCMNVTPQVPLSADSEHQFYSIGLSQVTRNSVSCRMLRFVWCNVCIVYVCVCVCLCVCVCVCVYVGVHACMHIVHVNIITCICVERNC